MYSELRSVIGLLLATSLLADASLLFMSWMSMALFMIIVIEKQEKGFYTRARVEPRAGFEPHITGKKYVSYVKLCAESRWLYSGAGGGTPTQIY